MSAPPFLVTFFPDKWANFKQEQILDKAALVRLIETEHASAKDLLRLLKLAKFGELRTGRKGHERCLRSDANMQWITGIEVDYDDEEILFDDAVQIVDNANLDYIAYTTPSHSRDKPRWRILFPLSDRAQVSERDKLVSRVNGLFNGKLGPESWTKSQSFYFGYITNGAGTPPTDFRVVSGDGDCIDEATSLGDTAIHQKHKTRDEFTGEYSYVDFAALVRAFTSGGDFHPLLPPIIGTVAARGVSRAHCVELMRGLFETAMKERPDIASRWDEVIEVVDYVYNKEEAKEDAKAPPRPPGAFIKSSKEFIEDFTPPDFLIDRLLIQSFLYSLTGQTGSGKTAITLRLAASVALGIHFNGLDVTQRRVLYLAAENPIDVQMRWIALAQQMDFDPNTITVYFVEGIFKISDLEMLKAEAEKVGGDFGLVVIDTGPAFYEGEDQNSRTEMFKHARTFRNLINGIPGRPTVLANMHPTKRVGEDGLVPAGGGSFLNEIDGNLTAAKTDAAVELHWCGKLRGVEFPPLNFQIKPVTHERLKDRKGKLLPTVIAVPLSERDKENMEKAAFVDREMILALMHKDPAISIKEIAAQMGWFLGAVGDIPYKSRAQRITDKMIKEKLVKRTATQEWELLPAGKEVLGI